MKKTLSLICSLFLVMGPPALWALPQGASVVNGTAQFNETIDTLTVHNSDNAIINWSSFSIGANELTEFVQPGAHSSVLNRVIGGDPSQIYGTLKSNGHVYLINENGIFISSSGIVDTNGFTASTLNVDDELFRNGGELNFFGESTEAVTNLGEITSLSGDVYLIARAINNAGTITAPNGEVNVLAGGEVLLAADGTAAVRVGTGCYDLSCITAIENSGVIEAAKARLEAADGNIYALAIKNNGTVRATGAEIGDDGVVYFTSNGGDIDNAGTVAAVNGDGSGGTVSINGGVGSTVISSGVITASGTSGGTVEYLGEGVALIGNGLIDVSGSQGNGGKLYFGGDMLGQNDDIFNANAAFIGKDALIDGSGGNDGDGGRIIVWSNDQTNFHGFIDASSGAGHGDGGFVETSGKVYLNASGNVDASSVSGKGGEWLIDPSDLDIVCIPTCCNTASFCSCTWQSNPPGCAGSPSLLSVSSINANLNAGTSITIETNCAGCGVGVIDVQAAISKTSGASATITLNAHSDVIFSTGGSIISSACGNALNVVIEAGDGGCGRVEMTSGTSIVSNGGCIILGGPCGGPACGHSGAEEGILLNGATLDASGGCGGCISLYGVGEFCGSCAGAGVLITGGSTLTTNGCGTICITGTGAGCVSGCGADGNHGVLIEGASTLSTYDGGICIYGTGAGGALTDCNSGVVIRGNSTVSVANGSSGSLSIVGNAQCAANSCSRGVWISGSCTTVSAGGLACLTLSGCGATTMGCGNHGILIDSGATVSVACGIANITGSIACGGCCTNNSHGVYITGGASVERTGCFTCCFSVNGSGGWGNNSKGVLVDGGGSIQSVGAYNSMSILGTAIGAGACASRGVEITGSGTQINGGMAGYLNICGSSTNADGILVDAAAIVTGVGCGMIALTSGCPCAPDSLKIDGCGTVVGGAGFTGCIALSADRIHLDGGVVDTIGSVSVAPTATMNYMQVGASAAADNCGFTSIDSSELSRIVNACSISFFSPHWCNAMQLSGINSNSSLCFTTCGGDINVTGLLQSNGGDVSLFSFCGSINASAGIQTGGGDLNLSSCAAITVSSSINTGGGCSFISAPVISLNSQMLLGGGDALVFTDDLNGTGSFQSNGLGYVELLPMYACNAIDVAPINSCAPCTSFFDADIIGASSGLEGIEIGDSMCGSGTISVDLGDYVMFTDVAFANPYGTSDVIFVDDFFSISNVEFNSGGEIRQNCGTTFAACAVLFWNSCHFNGVPCSTLPTVSLTQSTNSIFAVVGEADSIDIVSNYCLFVGDAIIEDHYATYYMSGLTALDTIDIEVKTGDLYLAAPIQADADFNASPTDFTSIIDVDGDVIGGVGMSGGAGRFAIFGVDPNLMNISLFPATLITGLSSSDVNLNTCAFPSFTGDTGGNVMFFVNEYNPVCIDALLNSCPSGGFCDPAGGMYFGSGEFGGPCFTPVSAFCEVPFDPCGGGGCFGPGSGPGGPGGGGPGGGYMDMGPGGGMMGMGGPGGLGAGGMCSSRSAAFDQQQEGFKARACMARGMWSSEGAGGGKGGQGKGGKGGAQGASKPGGGQGSSFQIPGSSITAKSLLNGAGELAPKQCAALGIDVNSMTAAQQATLQSAVKGMENTVLNADTLAALKLAIGME